MGFIGRRTAQGLVAFVGLASMVFFLARLTGDPSIHYLPLDASPAMRQDFAIRHGFAEPLLVQFGRFLSDLLVLDFGESLRLQRPALDVVLQAFPTTLMLAAISMGIALVISVVTGSLAAWRPGGVFDRLSTLISLIGASVPNFWIAIVGILIFAVGLRILPTSGYEGPIYWVLPVAVLILRPCGLLTQVVRGAMITALSSGYVKTARAKGVGRRAIVFVHALRNAMLPVLTVAGDQAADLISGAVIVETVFGFPGVGKLMIDSVTYRDFATLQATVLVTAMAIFVMNVVVDLIYAVLDPRIRVN